MNVGLVDVCTCRQNPTMTCRVHLDRDSIAYCRQRIAELEAQELGFIQTLSSQSEELRRLREERALIGEFIFREAPFDECAGVDIHAVAYDYDGDTPTPEGYYRAFLDCCRAALPEDE